MAILYFYDYFLTLEDEASELLVMTLDYTLTPDARFNICGDKRNHHGVSLAHFDPDPQKIS